jgi:hypothetical protein
MKTTFQPENYHIPTAKPLTTQPEPLIATGGVCKECMHEDFDSCVCPEPEKGQSFGTT